MPSFLKSKEKKSRNPLYRRKCGIQLESLGMNLENLSFREENFRIFH